MGAGEHATNRCFHRHSSSASIAAAINIYKVIKTQNNLLPPQPSTKSILCTIWQRQRGWRLDTRIDWSSIVRAYCKWYARYISVVLIKFIQGAMHVTIWGLESSTPKGGPKVNFDWKNWQKNNVALHVELLSSENDCRYGMWMLTPQLSEWMFLSQVSSKETLTDTNRSSWFTTHTLSWPSTTL
jgi:hypothetical protein